MTLRLRDVPDTKVSAEAREHMRTHVYVNIMVTDRNPDRGYRAVGYRVWASRADWYSATDTERSAAIQDAANSLAHLSAKPPTEETS